MILEQPRLDSNPPNESGREWGATKTLSMALKSVYIQLRGNGWTSYREFFGSIEQLTGSRLKFHHLTSPMVWRPLFLHKLASN